MILYWNMTLCTCTYMYMYMCMDHELLTKGVRIRVYTIRYVFNYLWAVGNLEGNDASSPVAMKQDEEVSCAHLDLHVYQKNYTNYWNHSTCSI